MTSASSKIFGLGGGARRPASFGYMLYPTGWLYQSKVRANRYFDEMLERIDPGQRRYFGERTVPSSAKTLTSPPQKIYYLMFTLLAPALDNLGNRYVQTATVTDLARLACALERFRLARGAFPQALSELTPDFFASLPAEIVNGEPYRDRRTEGGRFLLYSVGTDLRDGGGLIDPKESAKEQADWVWRYPVR